MTRQLHPFPPVWDSDCRVLLLGSFPSVRSRETGFFYGHPRNRFWPLLAALLDCPVPQTVPEKRELLLQHHLALWDVLAACDIEASSDSSIRNAVPNDLLPILHGAPVRHVFCNGTTAYRLYVRYQQPLTKLEAVCLPSTSPANARWQMDRLLAAWRCILSEPAAD